MAVIPRSSFRHGRRYVRTSGRYPSATAADLRMPFLSRMTQAGLVARVEAEPGLAFVADGTDSMSLSARIWRRRADIGEIIDVSRGPHRRALLHRLLRAFDERGVALVLLDYDESSVRGLLLRVRGLRADGSDRRVLPAVAPAGALGARRRDQSATSPHFAGK